MVDGCQNEETFQSIMCELDASIASLFFLSIGLRNVRCMLQIFGLKNLDHITHLLHIQKVQLRTKNENGVGEIFIANVQRTWCLLSPSRTIE